jgi:hypothetical protein
MQKLQVTAAKEVGEVDLSIRVDDTKTNTFTIEFWSDELRAGTKYGDTSNVVDVADTDTLWVFYTADWVGKTMPSFSGDVFMHVIYGGLDTFQVQTTATVTAYVDDTYDAWRDNITPADFNNDLTFRIRTVAP